MMIRHLVLAAAMTFTTQAFAADIDAPALWKKHCKGCHGEVGKAETKKGKEYKVDDITTAKWQGKHKDEDIKKAISDGLGPKTDDHPFNDKMKAFKEKLKPEEIDALVAYIRTLKA
jgi:mono/diheme cytochrome c family protein